MNEQQKKLIKSIYDGFTFYVNENLERLFSSAIPNDRVFESCKGFVHKEVYEGEAKNIELLIRCQLDEVKQTVANSANSIIGRVLRVAEMSLDTDKREAFKPLVTNIVWKNIDIIDSEIEKVKRT